MGADYGTPGRALGEPLDVSRALAGEETQVAQYRCGDSIGYEARPVFRVEGDAPALDA